MSCKCMECGAVMGREKRNVPYMSLPSVTLMNVDVYVCPKCGAEDVVIPYLEGLNQSLASALIESNSANFTHYEAKFLRKYLGLSSDQLARELGVDDDRVLDWERGAAMTTTEAAALRLLVAYRGPVHNYHAPDWTVPAKPKAQAWRVNERQWEPQSANA